MSIALLCPSCEKQITAPDAAAGRTGKCPFCSHRLVIPATEELPLPAVLHVGVRAAHVAPSQRSTHSVEKTRASRGRLKILAVLALLIVVSGSAYFLLRKKKPNAIHTPGDCVAALREIAALTPDDVALVGTAQHSNDDFTSELRMFLDYFPELKQDLEQSRDKSKAELHTFLGFDPDDEKAWAGAGLDIKRPVALICRSFNYKNWQTGFLENSIFAIKPTDTAVAERTLRRLWEQSTDAQFKELLKLDITLPEKRELATATSGGHLLAKPQTALDSGQVLSEFLEAAQSHPLSTNPHFIACMAELPAHADSAAYLNAAVLFKDTPKDRMLEFLSTFLAAGVTTSTEENDAFILLEHSDVLDQFNTGGECKDFLARFDPPVAAASWSVANLAELMRALERAMNHDPTDFDLNDYGELLKNNSGGVLIYPDESKAIFPFKYAVFIQINDADVYEALRKKHNEKSKHAPETGVRKEFGKNVLYVDEAKREVTGRIGNCFVSGDALTEIEALANGSAKGWRPAIGGRKLLEFEVLAAPLLRFLVRKESADIQRVVRDNLDETLNFHASLEGRPNGIYYHGEAHGLFAAAVKLIGELKPYLPNLKTAWEQRAKNE